MKFPIWMELVCAKCAVTTAGRFTYKGSIPVRQMKNEAKAQGWIFIFNYNDCFCSKECAEKYFDEVVNNE